MRKKRPFILELFGLAAWVAVSSLYYAGFLIGNPRSTSAPSPGLREERIQRIENGLLPPVLIKGRHSKMALSDRMKHYQTPGISIALVNDGKVEWVRAYGVREAGSNDPVTPETLFQAASISKPVTAMSVLSFVERGKLKLDEDVNAKLISWKIPDQQFTAEKKVTVRGLLSHSAGVTVHGFPGYGMDEPVPTLLQVLDGTKPANSAPIRVDIVPGSQLRYSGGGYCILQQLLIDLSRESFPQVMQESVLAKIGMGHSTYEQPLPKKLWPLAATGHRSDGQPVKGKWHTYPEMAPAGLWTTPTDLALFVIELQESKAGKSNKVLSKATVDQMLSKQIESAGLGHFLDGEGDSANFSHGGANAGFRCSMFAYSEQGKGAVIMTNSDNGGQLADEIVRAIASEYAWPNYRLPKEKTVSSSDPAKYVEFEGQYPLDQNFTLTITREKNRLITQISGQGEFELLPEAKDKFFFADFEAEITFVRDETGKVTQLILHQRGDHPAKKVK
jgi:CubicO group peptidase (beta-lactamase class C family)